MRVKSRDYADIIPAFSYDTARVMNYSVLRRTGARGRSGVEGGVTASTLFAAFFRLQ